MFFIVLILKKEENKFEQNIFNMAYEIYANKLDLNNSLQLQLYMVRIFI